MAQRSLNKVLLLGNVGKDPEVRYTASGRAVATFSIATSQRWKDQEGKDQEKTEWHRIVAWGRLGEICGEFLSKGKQVYVEGRIQSREWEDQDGNKRLTVEIVANDIILLGNVGTSSRSQDEGVKRNVPASGQNAGAFKSRPDDRGAYSPPPPDDDIPF
ncbi:MAG: single-stranded DNA-binding protein [Deltaproteobacteria bacterium]|nr:single-stranded DNA-binding protein [Deltaproteobacteria bacterium]